MTISYSQNAQAHYERKARIAAMRKLVKPVTLWDRIVAWLAS